MLLRPRTLLVSLLCSACCAQDLERVELCSVAAAAAPAAATACADARACAAGAGITTSLHAWCRNGVLRAVGWVGMQGRLGGMRGRRTALLTLLLALLLQLLMVVVVVGVLLRDGENAGIAVCCPVQGCNSRSCRSVHVRWLRGCGETETGVGVRILVGRGQRGQEGWGG